jgi:excisionase family DNA binding protein
MSQQYGSDAQLPVVLDAPGVAELLQLNVDYVRKLSREGVLPGHRIPGGRTFRFFPDEVLEWLRAQPAHHDETRTDEGSQANE